MLHQYEVIATFILAPRSCYYPNLKVNPPPPRQSPGNWIKHVNKWDNNVRNKHHPGAVQQGVNLKDKPKRNNRFLKANSVTNLKSINLKYCFW